MSRVGTRMNAIVSYIRNNPGCCILEASMQTAGRNELRGASHRFGYAAFWRAVEAGLVTAEKAGNRYKCYVTINPDECSFHQSGGYGSCNSCEI